MESAQRLLRSCLQPQGGAALARRGGAVQPLVERLQGAYADIWQLRLLQGLEKLKVCRPYSAGAACDLQARYGAVQAAHARFWQLGRLQRASAVRSGASGTKAAC